MSETVDAVTIRTNPQQIKEDLECFACGYNLRTLRSDAVCTECGGPNAAAEHANRARK